MFGIDDELFREHADGRDFLARRESSGGDEMLHLIDDLNVDGDTVRGTDMNLHKVY